MAKSLIINTLGGVGKWVFLPCNDTTAATFATNFLDGEYSVMTRMSESGTDTGITAANKIKAYGRDTTTFKSTTISFTAKSTISDEDIIAALTGKTFNGVNFDEVRVSVIPVTFS